MITPASSLCFQLPDALEPPHVSGGSHVAVPADESRLWRHVTMNISAAMSAMSRPGRDDAEVLSLQDESYFDRSWSMGSDRAGRPASGRLAGQRSGPEFFLHTQRPLFPFKNTLASDSEGRFLDLNPTPQ
jgi:hypothetical protein